MRRAFWVAAMLVAAGGPAMAELPVSLTSCLQDGYEIKAAFSDNSGGAYIVLQKGTSAYMCHSNPSPRCEKLN